MNQCKGHHGYKTAEITLLCHKVLFLPRGRIACNAERCIRLSVRPSVCHTLVPYPDE